MATRDKYNFTQQTIDWGTIIYNDVPSYSITSVGTTGNAYLVRNFLKKFFPFLDLSVNKTSGGSVNVKIKSYVVKFKFEENGVDKEFLLNPKALEDILEPLFEGQGFDGMTDSTYSKPIPPMYNDLGQDVSYGYGYLFVGADNLDSIYEVDLDVPLASSKYQFKVVRNDGPIMFDQKLQIPQKTEEYIKRVANGISSSASTQTNQSDFVTLEKGDAKLSLTTSEQEIINFLAEKQQKNVKVTLKEIISEFEGRNYTRDIILSKMSNLVKEDLLDSKSYNSDLVYYLSAKGLDYVSNPAVQILVEEATPLSKPIPMATEGEMASFKFISQNIDTLKDMEKNDPELFDALSQGIRLLQNLTANTTGELLPFTPTGDQEKIESALTDDDFDLNEADLEEIDLSGIEEDLELNDDELADLDLGEFEELKEFVENELMPSKPLTPELYSVLTAVVVAGIGKGDEATIKDIFDLASKERSKGYRIDNAGLKPEEDQSNNLTWDLFTLEEEGYVNRKADKTFGTVYYSVTDKGNEAILKYPEEQKQVSNAPFDIENLSALEKNILLILDKPPAAEKGTLYNEMTLSEIWAEVDETIASQHSRDLVQVALDNLIDYQLVNKLNRFPEEYRNFDDERTNATISELKKKPTTLTPTTLKILRILYRFTGKLSADNIKDDLSFEKVAIPHKAVFNRLIELRDMGLVEETNTSYGGIVWQITQAGNEYIDKLYSTTGTKVGLRPSPTDSATMYNVGTIKVGNDGNNWQIKESKTGVKRWVKMK